MSIALYKKEREIIINWLSEQSHIIKNQIGTLSLNKEAEMAAQLELVLSFIHDLVHKLEAK